MNKTTSSIAAINSFDSLDTDFTYQQYNASPCIHSLVSPCAYIACSPVMMLSPASKRTLPRHRGPTTPTGSLPPRPQGPSRGPAATLSINYFERGSNPPGTTHHSAGSSRGIGTQPDTVWDPSSQDVWELSSWDVGAGCVRDRIQFEQKQQPAPSSTIIQSLSQ